MKKILLIGIFSVSTFVSSNQLPSIDYVFVSFGDRQESIKEFSYLPMSSIRSIENVCSQNISFNERETICSIKKSDSISTIGVGFKIGSNILELSYADLGASIPSGNVSLPVISLAAGQTDFYALNHDYSLFQINSISYKNFSNKIQGYAKYGISYLQNDLNTTDNTFNFVTFKEKIELTYGLGINFDYFDSVNFFIEFMDSGHSIPSSYSLGIKYFLNK